MKKRIQCLIIFALHNIAGIYNRAYSQDSTLVYNLSMLNINLKRSADILVSEHTLHTIYKPSTLKELTLQKVAQSASKIYQAQGWEALENYLSPLPRDLQEQVFTTLIYDHAFDAPIADQLFSLYIQQGWEKAKEFFENLPYESNQRLEIQATIIAALTQQLPDTEKDLKQFNQILALLQQLLTLVDLKTQLEFVYLTMLLSHKKVNESIRRITTRIIQDLTREFNKNKFIQAFPHSIQQQAQTLLQTLHYADPLPTILTLLQLPQEQAQQILEYLVFDYGIKNENTNQQVEGLLDSFSHATLSFNQLQSLFSLIQTIFQQFTTTYPFIEEIITRLYINEPHLKLYNAIIHLLTSLHSFLIIELLREGKENQAVTLLKSIPPTLKRTASGDIIFTMQYYKIHDDLEQTILKKVIRFILPFVLTEEYSGNRYYILNGIIDLLRDKNISDTPHEFVAQQVATLENSAAYKEILNELQELEEEQ